MPWTNPCPECGGENEHRPSCPFLNRFVAPMVNLLDALDILCGDEPRDESLVRVARAQADGSTEDEWVAVCICMAPVIVDGVCRNCLREVHP